MRFRQGGHLAFALVLALLSGCGDDTGDESGDGAGLADLVDGAAGTSETEAPVTGPEDDDQDAGAGSAADDDAAGDDDSVESAEVTIDGEPLPPHERNPDPGLGPAAPVLRGTAIDGSALEIDATDGPMLVAFIAHWCPHCQNEVPEVVRWLDDGGLPDEVELYAVSTAMSDMRPNWPPSEWLADEEWPVPTLADDEEGSAHLAFGGGGFPYWVAVDADGRVVARHAGELGPEGLDELAEAALTGTPANTVGA